jgi:acetyl-CoA C-acetyltransferase
MPDVFILGTARTPIGAFQGALGEVPAWKLGGIALQAAIERSGAPAAALGEVFMGCVLGAGQGQAPARQAAHHAAIPRAAGAVTVNKVCGSGLKAVALAAASLRLGDAELAAAGGMESMSLAPYLLPKAREGMRLGHGQIIDSLIHDGLWDPYGNVHMGDCAELCAREKGIGREAQDAYAAESFRRARSAHADGKFRAEIVPVPVAQRKGPPRLVTDDESPLKGDPEKLGALRPAFQKDGTITAGNASSLGDGAAAVVLGTGTRAGPRPLARIVAVTGYAGAPEWFTTAPASAIEALLARASWRKDDVDLWEINEAFAVVSLVNNQLVGLDPARVNIWGGAIALGHPIGASGARLLVTLLSAMADRGAKRGVVALCIGGGEGIAMAVERP